MDKIYFQPKQTADNIQTVLGPKNLLKNQPLYRYVNGVKITNKGGYTKVSGTATEESTITITRFSIIHKGNYKLIYSNVDFRVRLAIVSLTGKDLGTKNVTSGYEFSVNQDCYIWVNIIINNGQTIDTDFYVMLTYQECSNDFASYSPDINTLTNKSYLNRDITDMYASGELDYRLKMGDFIDDLIFPGDMLIGQETNTEYYIGHIDYWLKYNTIGLSNVHHLIIFPRIKWIGATGKMNETNTTEGGYWNSNGRQEVDQLAQDYFIKDFGSHIKPFTNLLTTVVTNGVASSWEWKQNRYADLMSEAMVNGTTVFGANSGFNTGTQKEQLDIFKKYGCGPVLGAQYFFLKDVYNATDFAIVNNVGAASVSNASVAHGFLPFAIYGPV